MSCTQCDKPMDHDGSSGLCIDCCGLMGKLLDELFWEAERKASSSQPDDR